MCFSVQGPVLETTVDEDVNSILIVNLQSGTEYSVRVKASYPAGESEPQLINAKTCKCPSHKPASIQMSECRGTHIIPHRVVCWLLK